MEPKRIKHLSFEFVAISVIFVLIDKNFDYWYLCHTQKIMIMLTSKEREFKVAEYFLRSFEEKSPLDYDILDSMFQESDLTIPPSSQKKPYKD